MTTDELIERLNKNIYIDAELDDGEIEVADGSGDSFFVIPINATNFLEIIFVESPADVLNKVASEYVAAQIEEYLQTPIEERFPEKKYHLATLQYPKDAIPIKQYVSDIIVGYDHVNFYFGSKEKAGVWADSDLNYLSQYFPKEAIDAMEEPVEDD